MALGQVEVSWQRACRGDTPRAPTFKVKEDVFGDDASKFPRQWTFDVEMMRASPHYGNVRIHGNDTNGINESLRRHPPCFVRMIKANDVGRKLKKVRDKTGSNTDKVIFDIDTAHKGRHCAGSAPREIKMRSGTWKDNHLAEILRVSEEDGTVEVRPQGAGETFEFINPLYDEKGLPLQYLLGCSKSAEGVFSRGDRNQNPGLPYSDDVKEHWEVTRGTYGISVAVPKGASPGCCCFVHASMGLPSSAAAQLSSSVRLHAFVVVLFPADYQVWDDEQNQWRWPTQPIRLGNVEVVSGTKGFAAKDLGTETKTLVLWQVEPSVDDWTHLNPQSTEVWLLWKDPLRRRNGDESRRPTERRHAGSGMVSVQPVVRQPEPERAQRGAKRPRAEVTAEAAMQTELANNTTPSQEQLARLEHLEKVVKRMKKAVKKMKGLLEQHHGTV